MANNKEDFYYTNESFSGCDMVATILLPDINTGSRKAYTLGEMQTVSYSIHMDRSPVRAISNINAKDYVMGPRTIAGSLSFAVFNKHFAKKIMGDINAEVGAKYAFLTDELPPFDIVISAANEYGLRSRMVIYNVKIVNEGQVMSVNDVYTENTYQFVALDVEYLNNENEYINGSRSRKGTRYYLSNNDDLELRAYKEPKGVRANISLKNNEIILNHRQMNFPYQGEKIITEIYTTPTKRNGSITFKNLTNGMNKTFDVSSIIKKNGKMTVLLDGGMYEAQWMNNSEKSQISSFYLENRVRHIKKKSPAPTVDYVDDTNVRLTSSNNYHTRVLYGEVGKEKFSFRLNGFTARLNNLKPGTVYCISTCDEKKTDISNEIKILTMDVGYSEFNNLKQYCFFNKSSLKYDLASFNEVINDASKINVDKKYNSISISIQKTMNTYNDKLNSLDSKEFSNDIEYLAKQEELNIKIQICKELISIINNINYDKIYGYNYKTSVIESPKIIYKNGSKNILEVSNITENVEFYKKYDKAVQFDKKINKNNFYENGNKKRCEYHGKENTMCVAYATNLEGIRSAKTEFYVFDNKYRSEKLEEENKNNNIKEYELKKAEFDIGASISESFEKETKERILVEHIKNKVIKKVQAPTILEVKSNSITIKITDSIEQLKNENALISICPLEDALIDVPVYKQNIKEMIIFNSENSGIKPGRSYVIYIEDSNCNQISKTVTTTTLNNILLNDDKKNKEKTAYSKNMIAERILDKLKEVNTLDETISIIIDSSVNEEEVSEDEMIDDIILKAMRNKNYINNIEQFIYLVSEVGYEINYNVKSDLLGPVIIDKNKLLVEEVCHANIKIVNNEGIVTRSISINDKILDLDQFKYSYLIINFSKDDLSRSGFLLISSDNLRSYLLEVKEVR